MAGKEIMEGCGIVIVKEAEASEIVNSSRQIQMIIYTYGNDAIWQRECWMCFKMEIHEVKR